jgi:hypothetical protein
VPAIGAQKGHAAVSNVAWQDLDLSCYLFRLQGGGAKQNQNVDKMNKIEEHAWVKALPHGTGGTEQKATTIKQKGK